MRACLFGGVWLAAEARGHEDVCLHVCVQNWLQLYIYQVEECKYEVLCVVSRSPVSEAVVAALKGGGGAFLRSIIYSSSS